MGTPPILFRILFLSLHRLRSLPPPVACNASKKPRPECLETMFAARRFAQKVGKFTMAD